MVWSNKLLLSSSSLIQPGDLDAVNGGYRAYNNFGDGLLYNLNVAAKSTEGSYAWGIGAASTNLIGATSRLSGHINTTKLVTDAGGNAPAAVYAEGLSFGSQTDWYLGAIDELRAIAGKLKPSAATQVVFQSGGSEEFVPPGTPYWWSSTETLSNNAAIITMNTGVESNSTKTPSYLVRPIRRFATTMPYPIGTAMQGGYLAAYFTDFSTGSPLTYMLIASDKSNELLRLWDGGAGVQRNVNSRTDGPTNTTNSMVFGSAATNAQMYADALVSGGFSDWYMPAVDELLACHKTQASMPVGQTWQTAQFFFSSTEDPANPSSNAKVVSFSNSLSSAESFAAKTTNNFYSRPIRRVLLS